MKLGPVSKLGKRNTATSKRLTMSCLQIVMSLPFFQFMTNLEQAESQIPDVWFIKHFL